MMTPKRHFEINWPLVLILGLLNEKVLPQFLPNSGGSDSFKYALETTFPFIFFSQIWNSESLLRCYFIHFLSAKKSPNWCNKSIKKLLSFFFRYEIRVDTGGSFHLRGCCNSAQCPGLNRLIILRNSIFSVYLLF